MGRDGTAGLGAIKRAGGYAIVQDQVTSVVWGMPGSAVEAGLADVVLPLGEIAAAVEALVGSIKTD
jgi:two-component system chemotaxis response regulator CheB